MSKGFVLAAVGVIGAVLLAAGLTWRLHKDAGVATGLTLYGNVDIRTVNLAFNDSGRISRLLVEEGSLVRKGQLLAELDPARFEAVVQQARGMLAVHQQSLALLVAGNRPQQIAEAQATLDGARAALQNATQTYQRQKALAKSHLVPQQSADNALEALKSARAAYDAARQVLDLQREGSRKESIAAARGQVEADRGTLMLAERELSDTRLYAPADGVVQTRVQEVGDMASPQTPVLTLALVNPVWARVYVPETELGRIASGMRAKIQSDSFPGQSFPGWIGFVSPTAEFTPKSVQTTELRTELVYRARIYACNDAGKLRLGMPVTVHVPLQHNVPEAIPSDVCSH